MSKARIILVDKQEEKTLVTDADKIAFLDDLLNIYWSSEVEGDINYDYRLRTQEGELLYFSGFRGLRTRELYETFVQDLVASREILDISKDRVDEFNKRLLEYVIELDEQGFIRDASVKINGVHPEKIQEAVSDLKFNSSMHPVGFISSVEAAVRSTWLRKIQENVGDYDPFHIQYELHLAFTPISSR